MIHTESRVYTVFFYTFSNAFKQQSSSMSLKSFLFLWTRKNSVSLSWGAKLEITCSCRRSRIAILRRDLGAHTEMVKTLKRSVNASLSGLQREGAQIFCVFEKKKHYLSYTEKGGVLCYGQSEQWVHSVHIHRACMFQEENKATCVKESFIACNTLPKAEGYRF